MKKYFKRIYPWIGIYFVIVLMANVDNKVIWIVQIWQILKCQNVITQSTINGFHGYALSNIKYNAARPTFVVKHMIVYRFRKFNIMEFFQRESWRFQSNWGDFFEGSLDLLLAILALFEKRFFSFLSVTWLSYGQLWAIHEERASLIQCHSLSVSSFDHLKVTGRLITWLGL